MALLITNSIHTSASTIIDKLNGFGSRQDALYMITLIKADFTISVDIKVDYLYRLRMHVLSPILSLLKSGEDNGIR